ncbi:Hypothetical predicted protein [Marmota monax]|uniref:Uncharacterized protein n=1 Tax=Marmota monax TaxID=9995 RepID=A0A5E4AG72_MARMO|nr:Hypothetical predicted protein [Marmota monax]
MRKRSQERSTPIPRSKVQPCDPVLANKKWVEVCWSGLYRNFLLFPPKTDEGGSHDFLHPAALGVTVIPAPSCYQGAQASQELGQLALHKQPNESTGVGQSPSLDLLPCEKWRLLLVYITVNQNILLLAVENIHNLEKNYKEQ